MNHFESHREIYSRRLDAAREARAAEDRRDSAIANARLGLFVVAALVAVASLWIGWISPWWLVAPLILFILLVRIHGRASRAKDRATRAIAIYERGLARMDDRWIGLGPDGSRFIDASHPYAADLDLFGKGSLFQRISTARTRAGERVLATWLLAPADPDTIDSRQEAVAELAEKLDFREDLAREGEALRDAVEVEALLSWSGSGEGMRLPLLRLIAPLLGTMTTISLAAWFFLNLDGRLALAVVGLGGMFALGLRKPCGRILNGIEERAADLAMMAAILERIERETFEADLLTRLQASLILEHQSASSRIVRLYKTVDLLEWRRNMFFAPFALAWLWGTQVALAAESWRRRSGRDVVRWIGVLAEFEALASIAAYRFENPDAPFAEIARKGGPNLDARGLGHPLLPRATCVRNDARIGGELRVLVVSGSNMSGKSTLLRAIGTNVVLALAGAPVRAERMSLSPMGIGATLRIQDSLQEGKSRFYAEILRLRQVVDLTNAPLPLLFLLDEILHGTNSHDRLEGASAIVRGLIDRGAIGLVTTHDLALAAVAETLAPRAANVHFEDHFEDGVMRFDYTMRPGVVRNSNALALMRAVGLDV